jgi:hypothetical protein
MYYELKHAAGENIYIKRNTRVVWGVQVYRQYSGVHQMKSINITEK